MLQRRAGALDLARLGGAAPGAETGRALMIGMCRETGQDLAGIFTGQGHAPAPLTDADAQTLGEAERATVWYRHGWRDRMRLVRLPTSLRTVIISAGGMLALGILCLVAGWVLYFARG